MPVSAGYLLVLFGPAFLGVEAAFGFAHEIEFLLTLVDKDPVGIIGADRCVGVPLKRVFFTLGARSRPRHALTGGERVRF